MPREATVPLISCSWMLLSLTAIWSELDLWEQLKVHGITSLVVVARILGCVLGNPVVCAC